MGGRRTTLITIGIVAFGTWIGNIVRKILSRDDDFDGLKDIVAYSSQKIAAVRALETEEEEPVCKDPLAAALAGQRAIREARKHRKTAPSGFNRRYKLNARAMRTRWFDDQIEASLDMFNHSLEEYSKRKYVAKTVTPGHRPRQVVMLGAGMDSRPWRLRLPSDVVWFEVDVEQVIDKKYSLLKTCGAEIPSPAVPLMKRAASSNTALKQRIGTLDQHAVNVEFPLRAASWKPVCADLDDQKWIEKLIETGFDKDSPTLWVAEGLLMYLSPKRAEDLLKEAASVSAPGSALVTVSVIEEVIEDIQKRNSRKQASDLMSTWRFGCPRDPTDWLQKTGWKDLLVTSRGSLADALDIDHMVCDFDGKGQGRDGRLLFIVATLNT